MSTEIFKQMAKDAAMKEGINPDYVFSIIEIESGWNPKAVSPTGCTGLMQLSRACASDWNVSDRADPQQNLTGGCKQLSRCLRAVNGDYVKAGLLYNQGVRGGLEMLAGKRTMAPEGQSYMQKLRQRGW